MKDIFLLHEKIFDSEEKLEEARQIIKSKNYEPIVVRGHYYEPKNEEFLKNNKIKQSLLPVNWYRYLLGGFNHLDYCVTSYLKYVINDYLNKDFLMYPFYVLKNNFIKNHVISLVKTDKIFIRPNSGLKNFTGFCFDFTDWDKEIPYLKCNDNDDILISSYKNIKYEWRFYIINNEVVTYSFYSCNSNKIEVLPLDHIIEKAKIISKNIKYLKNFTLDLCIENSLNEEPKVVEINNLNTSGTYNCNLEDLISKMIIDF